MKIPYLSIVAIVVLCAAGATASIFEQVIKSDCFSDPPFPLCIRGDMWGTQDPGPWTQMAAKWSMPLVTVWNAAVPFWMAFVHVSIDFIQTLSMKFL